MCILFCYRNNRRGSMQYSKTRGTNEGMINSSLLPFRLNGTNRDDMTMFLVVVAELLRAILSNMTKSFTTKALDNMHIFTLISPLCCISHKNRCTNIFPMFHSSLSYNTLLLTKKFTQTGIQRWYRMTIHHIRMYNFKIRTELYQELISLACFMHYLNSRKSCSWNISINNI